MSGLLLCGYEICGLCVFCLVIDCYVLYESKWFFKFLFS